MTPLFWPILLMLVGLGMILLEVFVPSGGVIGVLSVASVLASIVLAFYDGGPGMGLIFLLIAAVGAPTLVAVGLRWWPHTPMGRRILLDLPVGDEQLPDSPERRMLRQLVGQFGVAKSKMLPSGAVTIGGRTFDAMSEGVAIEPGTRVRVVEVRSNRIVVRPVADDEAPPEDPGDILSQPIDKLGLDSWQDPLS